MKGSRSSEFRVLLATAAVALLLVLAVLLGGPRIGIKPVICYWLAFSVFVLWVLFLATWLFLRRRRAPGIGKMMHAVSQISVEPFGAAAVGERLTRTIQWLKNSKLAQTSKDPIYNLPWYLFMGLPGSGKSTLIVQSGFSFSYTEPKKPLGRPSVSPTEGCDFWVANEAVFIDPSGRYFGNDGVQDGWSSVLYKLKQQRKVRPADAIVLVVDVDSLLNQDSDGLRVQAASTRSFLDMTAKAFGMVLPVYLVFHKADLIEGFQEFFANTNGVGTPLGATLRQQQYSSAHPEEEFKTELDEIYKTLAGRRTSILAGTTGRIQEKAFAFPAQLPLIREKLSEFVEVLFQINQFREQPLFRGFYFASSTQTGQSRSPIADLMAAKTGLPKAADGSAVQQTKNYFTHSLFSRVMIPDRGLAGLSREVRRRRLLLRMVACASVAIVLPICLLAFGWNAYLDSSDLIAAAATAQRIDTRDGKTAENLAALLALKQRLEPFECHGQTPQCQKRGGRFYWGMHPGNRNLEWARSVFVEKTNALFLDPLLNADTRLGQKYNGLKTQLDLIGLSVADAKSKAPQPQFDPGRTYNLLKTFLMFSSEAKANPAFLFDQTQDYWCQGVQDQKKDEAHQILRFYLHQLGDHHNAAYRLTRSNADNETIERIRKRLLTVEPDSYYYQMIREEGKRKVDSISLAGILGNKWPDVFEANASVDGPYTKIGWDTFVKDRIAAMKADYEEERSWVLGTSAESPGGLKIDEKLRSYYFRDYQQSWWDFLRDIRVRRFSSLQDASQKLAVLTDNQRAPMQLLFREVSLNTWDDLDQLKISDIQQARALDGAGGLRFGVEENFQAIHSLTVSKENQDSALTTYTKSLSRLLVVIRTFIDSSQPAGQIPDIGREADAAMQTTNGLLVNLDANARQAVEPLLKQPIQEVMAILNHATPVGTVQDVRQRGISVGGTLKDKGKNLEGATILLMEAYSENKFLAGKEIMRAQTHEGTFQFPSPINAGPFKICATRKGENGYFCGDVHVDRADNGRAFVLKHPRSMVVFGGGQLDVILQIR
jgi:type VI secretion system protein ImpL